MPKQRQSFNAKKKTEKKREKEGPETANEYLAAGVSFEEAGEKWRAGDATKSLRFFVRAIETYQAGIQKFPQSIDLAYNKARLQYEVTQQPRLLATQLLPTPLVDLLQIALASHRFALRLEQDSYDLLFNTAQVLTSLAEITIEGRRPTGSHRDQALRLFQEALELFQRCLDLQEFRYTQAQESAAKEAASYSDPDNADAAAMSSTASNASEEEVWASVEEPVTKHSLLDTAIAQLDTLTAVCSLGSVQAHGGIVWAEEYYRTELQDKIKIYIDSPSHQHEAARARAKFISAVSDAAFRSGRLDLATYEREMNTAFSNENLDLINDHQGLCDRADAYLILNASVQNALQQAQPTEMGPVGNLCWKSLTKALDSLAAASKLPDAQSLLRIHLRRGDCELHRLRLGDAPLKYELAIKSTATLLKNAGVYFRGAAALDTRDADTEEEQKEAEVKEAIALALADHPQKLTSLIKLRKGHVGEIVEDMRDDGLLGEESLGKLGELITQDARSS